MLVLRGVDAYYGGIRTNRVAHLVGLSAQGKELSRAAPITIAMKGGSLRATQN